MAPPRAPVTLESLGGRVLDPGPLPYAVLPASARDNRIFEIEIQTFASEFDLGRIRFRLVELPPPS